MEVGGKGSKVIEVPFIVGAGTGCVYLVYCTKQAHKTHTNDLREKWLNFKQRNVWASSSVVSNTRSFTKHGDKLNLCKHPWAAKDITKWLFLEQMIGIIEFEPEHLLFDGNALSPDQHTCVEFTLTSKYEISYIRFWDIYFWIKNFAGQDFTPNDTN